MRKKLRKIIIFQLVIILLLGLAIATSSLRTKNLSKETLDHIQGVGIIDEKNNSSINLKENTYEGLEDNSLYNILKEGLYKGEDSIKFNPNLLGPDGERIFHIVDKILWDNPDILYYQSGKYSNGVFSPIFSKPIDEKLEHQEAIREKRDEIIAGLVNGDMDDYTRIKAIHDFIVGNTRYAREHLEGKKLASESYTVYGVLIKGKAVCEGYAKTMKYLLDCINIDNIIVIGTANGDNHAWNLVKIGGEYYHIDATWNDPVREDGKDIIIYDYFNLNDQAIGKTHTWRREDYPLASGEKYNYYYYNGLVALDYREFYNKVEEALLTGEEEISLKLPYYNEEAYNIPFTVENIVMNNPGQIGINKYAYSVNQEQNIVKIYFAN